MAVFSPSAPIPTADVSPPRRLEFLEGLRGLLAFWVVLSHLWILQYGIAAQPGLLGLLTNWLLYSHLAVDGFIVLSGFCLTLPVLRDRGLRGGAWEFYRRRAWRILPPCYLALGLAVALHGLAGPALDLNAILGNLLLLQDVAPGCNLYDPPLWSVAVECRIYLLFPLCVWLLQRGGIGGVLLFLTALGAALTALVFRAAPDALMACPWYLSLFGMGMAAAVAVSRRRGPLPWLWALPPLWALACLLHAFPVTAQGGVRFGLHMPWIDPAAGWAMAALLAAWAHRPRLPLLQSPALVALGRRSYSLYLLHLPLLTLALAGLNAIPGASAWPPLLRVFLLSAFGLPLVLFATNLFYHRLERPFTQAPLPI